jgi:hypothetical protein
MAGKMSLTLPDVHLRANARSDAAVSFATFWAGRRVSAYEAASMASFARHGYRFLAYSYEAIDNLPDGVEPADAAAIVEPGNQHRFLIRGAPNLSHFSDLFRYRLFSLTPHIWVDADMLMLRPLPVTGCKQLLAREDERTLCGAIMRLDAHSRQLPELIRRTEALRDRNLAWGATGPKLLTMTFGKDELMRAAHPPELFFPVHYNDFWMTFLPEYREACEERCAGASTIHLWNDRMVGLGIWKRFAPPEGSFLHAAFAQTGSWQFEGAYPADVMRNMVLNWRIRCEGGEIGLGQWSRKAWPSLKRTLRRRLNLPD